MPKLLKRPVPTMAPTAETENMIRQAMLSGVIIPQLAEVQSYLLDHPAATSIIVPAIEMTRRHVGSEPQLSLEVYRDPEVDGEQLTLYVRGNNYTDQFVDLVRAAAAELHPALRDRDDTFLVMTDLQPPK